MRQRVLSALSWAVVTFLATGIGLIAISTVGDVLHGSGPLGADVSIAEDDHHAPPAPATSRQRTFHHPLAILTAHCAGRTATLLSAQPAPGATITITDTDPGPDEDVQIAVDHAGTTTRLEIYCNRGEPRLVI